MKRQEVTILIVDDNDDFRQLLQSFLERQGYLTISASDGSQALALLTRDPPALIILDLNMPVMDGLNTARQIREQDQLRQVPIIFVTAHGGLGIELYGDPAILEGGAIEYLPKPLDLQLLSDLLKRLLEQPNQIQEK